MRSRGGSAEGLQGGRVAGGLDDDRGERVGRAVTRLAALSLVTPDPGQAVLWSRSAAGRTVEA